MRLFLIAATAPLLVILASRDKPANFAMQWIPKTANITPVIDLGNTYSYQPSAWQQASQVKVWFCGGDRQGKLGDAIYYATLVISGNLFEAPTRVMVPKNDDIGEDGAHACAPSVIRYRRGDGNLTYILYYECARRVYDRSRGFGRTESFTQICQAFSDDGLSWKKNGLEPVIKVANKILENCNYAFVNGKHSIESSRSSCNNYDNYGSGHPSAIIMEDVDPIWLYYFDSKGVGAERGTYLTKSRDGIKFGAPIKTNLPNDAHVKYFNGMFGGWPSVFIATTVINASNKIYVSGDGINWVSGGSQNDVGIAVSGHCAAPGPGEIVGNSLNHVSSLSIQFLSSEGYYGTGDNGRQYGCYSQLEDKGRGSTWKIHLIEGTIGLVERP
jgi:hypothetical protein